MKAFPPIPRPTPEPEIPLIDNSFSPEILAGGISGLAIFNGIVTITLETPRCDHSRSQPMVERIVVGRVSLPVHAAQALLSGLYQFMSHHRINPLAATEGASCQ